MVICLQIPTIFSTDRRLTFHQLLNVHGVDVRQTRIHTVEPSVPTSTSLEAQIATEKSKSYKSPDTDQIPTELIQDGGNR
jgi:hypothetical protein